MVFLHFMGAKPWMTNPAERQGADWEESNGTRSEYAELEQVWWQCRRGEITEIHLPVAFPAAVAPVAGAEGSCSEVGT